MKRFYKFSLLFTVTLLSWLHAHEAVKGQSLHPIAKEIEQVALKKRLVLKALLDMVNPDTVVQSTAVKKIAPDALLLSLNKPCLETIMEKRYSVMEIDIPISATENITLMLHQTQIVTDDFRITENTGNGTERQASYTPGLHYRGIVAGDSLAWAAISFFDNGLMGVIATEKGNLVLGKLQDADLYVLYNDQLLTENMPFTCLVADDEENTPPDNMLQPDDPTGAQLVCDKVVKVYIHCSNSMYSYYGITETALLIL
ncbi:MAG TPA: hypothetical protein PK239_16330 [Chitinophagales bacterium]|nr:hypothetical protein [Chitinophagales bacterium]HRK28842.1 hypothetical protein [Chitinophagales bacterium]